MKIFINYCTTVRTRSSATAEGPRMRYSLGMGVRKVSNNKSDHSKRWSFKCIGNGAIR